MIVIYDRNQIRARIALGFIPAGIVFIITGAVVMSFTFTSGIIYLSVGIALTIIAVGVFIYFKRKASRAQPTEPVTSGCGVTSTTGGVHYNESMTVTFGLQTGFVPHPPQQGPGMGFASSYSHHVPQHFTSSTTTSSAYPGPYMGEKPQSGDAPPPPYAPPPYTP